MLRLTWFVLVLLSVAAAYEQASHTYAVSLGVVSWLKLPLLLLADPMQE